jgi:GNAT superfamily N-acetyltransferase
VTAATTVRLRAPEPADVDGMLALVAACDESWRDWTPPDWEPPPSGSARWVTELGAPDRWTRLAVDAQDRVVGLVSWGPARTGPSFELVRGTAHVGALFVHPDRWREGIGARLLDAAIAAMREQGYARAKLNTPAGAPAERFYEREGWRREGEPRWHAVLKLPSVGYVREL